MKIRATLCAAFVLAFLSAAAVSQTTPTLKKTTTKTDKFDFASGGTLSVVGAPNGSITIVGTNKNEIEITAEIEVNASNEADLETLATITTFITDETASRTGVLSMGTHNKGGLKKLPKKFPKHLLKMPFRIDYVIHVPRYCDLEIDGGIGDFSVEGVEGTMRIKFIESNAKLEIMNGNTTAIFGSGTVDIALGVRGWRGRAADIQVGKGSMVVRLPANMSAELDAVVLRSGAIENLIPDVKPRDR